jgi:son of sevenless-like protein
MSARCVSLMVSLRDSSQGLEETKVLQIADEIELSVVTSVATCPNLTSSLNSIISRVHRKVKEWGSWNQLRSFLAQGEIKDGIDRLHRDIDAAMMKFSVNHLLFYLTLLIPF